MLIILYGDISGKSNPKQQRMIEGRCTCGYREYARNYGHIIYMCPQQVELPWEHCITNPNKVIKFIKKYPDAVVWSVKYNVRKDREILSKINNKKVYYSCNAHNMYNKFCNVSLVDTDKRIRGNAKLFFKGKDPEYWKPVAKEKEFDYLLVGRRADKNELFFLRRLNKVKDKRKILWIGGEKHKSKVKTNHDVIYTGFIGQDEVRDNISKAKVGILFTELSIEGFPQTFLELTMCGVPVVYNIKAPRNKFYFHDGNCLMSCKEDLIKNAEILLNTFSPSKCRDVSIKNYSLDKSYERIIKCIK